MAKSTTFTAGIDTAKDKLDAAIAGVAVTLSVPNDKTGWQELARLFAKHKVGRIGIEATGGYERGVVRALQTAGLCVVLLQPLQVKRFGQMRLQRAKNDRIDAALIAACTAVLAEDAHAPPDERFDALADHLTFIEQIKEDKARCKTRLEHIADKRLRAFVLADIARLEKRRAAELARLVVELRAHADLANKLDLVLSIPGIGARTALAVIVRMPELGQVARREAAALAGLRRSSIRAASMRARRISAAVAAGCGLALCGSLAGDHAVESRLHGALSTHGWPRQKAEQRAGGRRTQAADFCKHRGSARHALAAQAGSKLTAPSANPAPWFD